MVSRAFIIAIEEYPDVTEAGMAKKLDGTLKAALKFKEWVEAKWRSDGRSDEDTQMVFCSEPRQDGFGIGATRDDLVQALIDLQKTGKNMTDELLFYYSGHGYAFVSDAPRSDIIVGSDFRNSEISINRCINLDETINWLRSCMGVGKQYYFIDACRLKMKANRIAAPGNSFSPKSGATGEPTTYVLHSTITNAASVVEGAFQKSLQDGLKGVGKAKTWDDDVEDAMFVRYDSLRIYLTEKLKHDQPIEHQVLGQEGESDGILYTLKPVPEIDCNIKIKGASASEKGEIKYRHIRARNFDSEKFNALPATLRVPPGTYKIQVELDKGSVEPGNALKVELYDPKHLTFTKATPSPPLGAPKLPSFDHPGPDFSAMRPPSLNEAVSGLESFGGGGRRPRRRASRPRRAPRLYGVNVILPLDATAELQHVSSRAITVVSGNGEVELPGGNYTGTLRGADGTALEKRSFKVSTALKELNLTDWHANRPMRSIASHFPAHEDSLQFSESLSHERTEPDLAMWLAVIGAGRILSRNEGTYYKLGQLPLREFWNDTPTTASFYVLAGFEDPATRVEISISEGVSPHWIDPRRPGDLDLHEAYAERPPGQHFVTVRINEGMSYTFASFTMPNRCTFITLVQGPDRQPQFIQYLLPVGALSEHLHPAVQDRIDERNSLDDVRQFTRMFRSYRARQDVFATLSSLSLNDFLYHKWGNPIASSLAAYELMRRGEMRHMAQVSSNMREFFPELPDSWAIDGLASGSGPVALPGMPLFLDGLRAVQDYDGLSPFPSSHLDHSRPWTTWRGVI